MPVCSTQKQALHQMAVLPVPVSDCHVSCSAPDGSSGGDSVGLQCTRWQFWWWQCRPAVFSAVHLEGSAPDGSSVSASVSIPCSLQCIWKAQHRMAVLSVPVSAFGVLCSAFGTVVGAKLPLLVQQKASQWHLAQNCTAAMQPGILCN